MSDRNTSDLNRRRFILCLCLCLCLPVAALPKAARADALHDAVAKGSLSEVKRLLAGNPRLLEARNDDHLTPLLMAVALGKSDIARFLVQRGANVNARKADGNSPLFDAACLGDADVARLLIRHGAEVDARNQKGETPLHYTVIYDRPDVARVLLEHKAGVDRKQNDGQTPLLMAVKTDRPRLVRILIAHGADVRTPDKLGDTPLLLALSDLGGTLSQSDAALLSSVSVSLRLADTPLHDAFVRLFAQARQEATVSDALVSPVSMSLTTNLGDALGRLLHVGDNGTAAATVAVAAGAVQVSPAGTTVAGAKAETWPVFTKDPRFRFYQAISLPVLNNYLSRSVTHFGLCSSSPEPATAFLRDDLRMLTGLGAKFIGHAAYAWVPPDDEEGHFRQARERAGEVARADPEIVLQASIFEAVYEAVGRIPVPEWVFTEFGQPVEHRTFHYSAMLYDGGKYRDHWTKGASVPDMSKAEAKMYFYYRARRYLDSGFEALHFGQVGLMDENDPTHAHWWEVLARVRRYAGRAARRRMVLCAADTHGVVVGNGRLLFDHHAFPLLARDVKSDPQKVELVLDYYNCIYRRSAGGVTPSGWACEHLPYLCDFDCGGVSDRPGQPSEFPWNWGYACADWFAHQPAAYRSGFLQYAYDWLGALHEGAHLQMPTRLNLGVPVDGVKMWHANRHGDACPSGFSLEGDIQTLWKKPVA